MQSGQRLDGRDDGRGIPGRAGSRLGCLRLRCELRCRVGLVLRLCRVGLVLRLVLRGPCRARSFGRPLRTYLRQARYVEGAELAGKGHGAVSAALLLLLHATDTVFAGVKNLCDPVDLDRQPPSTRKDGVTRGVLAARRARNAEVGRPPVGRGEGGNTEVVASSWANSLHSASTRALSALSNMLPPTIVIPPCIHCPDPPSSGIEN